MLPSARPRFECLRERESLTSSLNLKEEERERERGGFIMGKSTL